MAPRPSRDTGRRQSSTPYWDPPECPINPAPGQRRQQDLQDTVTDVYKLGLAILRCLTPGKGASTARSREPARPRARRPGPGWSPGRCPRTAPSRPTAKELYAYLYSVAAPRIAAPEITMARLVDSRPAARPGRPDRVADQRRRPGHYLGRSELHSPGGPGRASSWLHLPGGRESGPVRLEAGNRFGSVTVDLGEITAVRAAAVHRHLRLSAPAADPGAGGLLPRACRRRARGPPGRAGHDARDACSAVAEHHRPRGEPPSRLAVTVTWSGHRRGDHPGRGSRQVAGPA